MLLTFVPLIGGSLSAYFSGDIKSSYRLEFPPAWIFGPVWTVLYIMMGYASQIVYNKTKRVPLIFWLQLALNLMWSPVYFKQRNVKLAKTIMIALICAAIFTFLEFRRIDTFASNLLIPYIAWLMYAFTVLQRV